MSLVEVGVGTQAPSHSASPQLTGSPVWKPAVQITTAMQKSQIQDVCDRAEESLRSHLRQEEWKERAQSESNLASE